MSPQPGPAPDTGQSRSALAKCTDLDRLSAGGLSLTSTLIHWDWEGLVVAGVFSEGV